VPADDLVAPGPDPDGRDASADELLEAQHVGLRLMRLETGIHQPEALALYRRAGYAERAPFGEYVADPLSVYMEKTLA